MRALVSHESAQTIALFLRADGWLVDVVDAEDALDMWVAAASFDVLIAEDPEAVRALRRSGGKTPAVVVAMLPSPSRAHAYTVCGVDAVVDSPLHRDELCAVVGALARRAGGLAQTQLAFGPLRVDLQSKQVDVKGQRLHLTRHEYNLFEALVLRDRVQTKQDLMDALYSASADDEPEIKIIDVFICKLRKKLREAGADGLIDTMWGRGYRFNRKDAVAA